MRKKVGATPPPLSDATCLFTAVLRSLDGIFTNFINFINKSLFLSFFALLSKITDIFHFLIVQPLNLIYKTIIYDRKCFNFIFFFDSVIMQYMYTLSVIIFTIYSILFLLLKFHVVFSLKKMITKLLFLLFINGFNTNQFSKHAHCFKASQNLIITPKRIISKTTLCEKIKTIVFELSVNTNLILWRSMHFTSMLCYWLYFFLKRKKQL